MTPQWYKWQFAQDLRGDPPYGVLAKSSGGEYTPGDFKWLPIAAGIQSPPRDTTGSGDPGPAYRERIAKHREYLELCRACDGQRSPEQQLQLFNELRALGL
jgi:hypothetical protein